MKKSILFIHPFLPYPMESGGHQALFNGIRAVKDDYDVTLAFSGADMTDTRKYLEEFKKVMPNVTLRPLLKEVSQTRVPSTREKLYINIRTVYHYFLDAFKKIMDVHPDEEYVRKEPDLTNYWNSTITPKDKDWTEHIYKVSREKHYDIIQIEMPWMIKDVFAMPKGSKLIHVHHELGFVRRELEIKNYGDNPFYQQCKRFVDMNEIGQLNMYDAVITLSPIDKKKLEEKGVKVPVYSSLATIDSSMEIAECKGNGKCLTFIGLGNHTPNFVGITWFLENCWKKLKAKDSAYTLDIIGKWSGNVIAEYTEKYPDVHFLGFVDDLYAAIKDSIMIVPITIGSGIRMKILEAASKGIPFVSTTVGAEGIPVIDGKDCLLTDDPDMFVEDIVKLQDVSLRNKFVRAAHNMVINHYSIQALRKNRLEIYKKVLGQIDI